MNRRTAIKQLFIVAGGIVIASSCSTDSNSASIQLNQIKLKASDELLLSNLVEAIIPETDSPGGKTMNLHLFVMKMLDDCYSEADQQAFLQGLEKAHKNLKVGNEVTYLSALPEDDVFKNILKRRTIQGYLNSEYVMKNKLVYELVPARYDGAVKIEA
ncbi:gluconate 2-dehydrogenase subunit 3 family protein [Sphingobacterium sp. UT-1RO-CII-1]|uniref:gluconate 2-dehydrogenase subunit 3 family protein n=1 Tax=Sphingobacterium sp. UT-1RO-CII-1 TaxID=2995225 RepID=UPI00227A32B4|nr:gluconate 2-dehydrogenase subunit 3 family protein [Sphingobacterium sp. UT-1RO-CII-1]MCY4778422.1 gluconate 2-dehydrogenase subunit 3 family protein [Sphingobacterium sp. UT-1RO-CII-1]